MTKDILRKTTEMLMQFPPSEHKVAQYILNNPEEVLHTSLALVAAHSNVSEPTVIRFCRSVGCKGFQNFKMDLALALASDTPYIHESIKGDDPVPIMAEKICNYSSNSLRVLGEALNMAAVEEAIGILTEAKRIEIYGSGASGIVAVDAQHKLFRMMVPTVAYRDAHLQMMSASSIRDGDVALVFSYTGKSRNIIEAATLAGSRGATVIAVTTKDSPLHELCSPVIFNPRIEDTDIFSPMVSRLCQLTIVDILATGVAMRKGDAVREHMHRIKKSVEHLRPTK